MNPIRHILVAVDFDENSARALDYAVDLAAHLGARLTAVHAYSLPVLNALDAEYIPSATEAVHKADHNRKHLDTLLTLHKARGVEIAGVLRVGAAPAEVCAVAREAGADLIVVGTHNRGALGRALLGSVAETIVREAHVPVLTVRPPRG
jgi:nucleotide-binding universal stress UspA family protein